MMTKTTTMTKGTGQKGKMDETQGSTTVQIMNQWRNVNNETIFMRETILEMTTIEQPRLRNNQATMQRIKLQTNRGVKTMNESDN
jgi:hypothetical protein